MTCFSTIIKKEKLPCVNTSLIWQGRRGGSMPFDTHVGSQDPKWAGIAFIFQSDAQSCISLVSGILYSKKKDKKNPGALSFHSSSRFLCGVSAGANPLSCHTSRTSPTQTTSLPASLRHPLCGASCLWVREETTNCGLFV